MRQDGSFCLLDWETAGFYPRVFASYCLAFVGIFSYEFAHDLGEALRKHWPKIENEQALLEMLDQVYRNNLRYS
jgi:hypothetical protein